MPLLGGLLAGLFGGVFQALASFLTKKTALAAAWVATLAALTVALIAAVAGIAGAFSMVAPGHAFIAVGFYSGAVDVGLSIGAACVGVDALCWVYRWNVNNLSLLARA